MIGSFLPVCLKDKDTVREKVTKFVLLRPGASAGISPRRNAGRVALQTISANLALLCIFSACSFRRIECMTLLHTQS
jgi:hypothetical protein